MTPTTQTKSKYRPSYIVFLPKGNDKKCMPKVGQLVRLVRDIVVENEDCTMAFEKGMIAAVTEVEPLMGIGRKHEAGYIGITFDKRQPTKHLQEVYYNYLQVFEQGSDEPARFYFYLELPELMNGMFVSGLLMFHLSCEYI